MPQSRCNLSLAMCPEPGYWKLELRHPRYGTQAADYLAYSTALNHHRSSDGLSRMLAKGSIKIKPLLRHLSAYTKEVTAAISQLRRDPTRPRNLSSTEDTDSMFDAQCPQSLPTPEYQYAVSHPSPQINAQNVLRIVNHNSDIVPVMTPSPPPSPPSPCSSARDSELGICSLSNMSENSTPSPIPSRSASPSTEPGPLVQCEKTGKQSNLLPKEATHDDHLLALPPRRTRNTHLQTRSYMEARRDRSRSMFLNNSPGEDLPAILKAGTRSEQ